MTTTADPAIEAFLGRVRELLGGPPARPTGSLTPGRRTQRLYHFCEEVSTLRRKRGGDPAKALAYLAAEAIRQGAAEEQGKGVGE
jgi:hypothetical protein